MSGRGDDRDRAVAAFALCVTLALLGGCGRTEPLDGLRRDAAAPAGGGTLRPPAPAPALVRCGGPSFAPVRTTPIWPAFDFHDLQAADVNGDGAPDLVLRVSSSDLPARGDLAAGVLLNTGRGTFASMAPIWGISPSLGMTAVAADFDADGRRDLAVGTTNRSVAVFPNDGGRFDQPREHPVGERPLYLAAGDFNGDGRMDLAAIIDWGVAVLMNQQDGFAAPVVYETVRRPNTSAEPLGYALEAADLNADARADLIVGLPGAIAVLLNRGDGTFPQLAQAYLAGSQPWSLTLADFNGDGALDVATGDRGDRTVSVLPNVDGGSFPSRGVSRLGERNATSSPLDVVAADFDGDGRIDLAASDPLNCNHTEGFIDVFTNLGGGNFAVPRSFPVGQCPWALAAADFDGDGRVDLAMSDDSIGHRYKFSVLMNDCR